MVVALFMAPITIKSGRWITILMIHPAKMRGEVRDPRVFYSLAFHAAKTVPSSCDLYKSSRSLSRVIERDSIERINERNYPKAIIEQGQYRTASTGNASMLRRCCNHAWLYEGRDGGLTKRRS